MWSINSLSITEHKELSCKHCCSVVSGRNPPESQQSVLAQGSPGGFPGHCCILSVLHGHSNMNGLTLHHWWDMLWSGEPVWHTVLKTPQCCKVHQTPRKCHKWIPDVLPTLSSSNCPQNSGRMPWSKVEATLTLVIIFVFLQVVS